MSMPACDEEGYLIEPESRSEDWARATAAALNLTLSRRPARSPV
ncbi:MAG: hypothetical protein R3E87_18365 [Burkholderiaceae bacterium]